MELNLAKIKRETLKITFSDKEINVLTPSKAKFEKFKNISKDNFDLDKMNEVLSELLSINTEKIEITSPELDEMPLSDIVLITRAIAAFYAETLQNPN